MNSSAEYEEPIEASPSTQDTFWARARAVAGDPRVWARVLLRAGAVSLIPGTSAMKSAAGYTFALPLVGAISGVVALLTLVERFLAKRPRQPPLFVMGAGLIVLAWFLQCVGLVEATYMGALLETGEVSAGLEAVASVFERLASGAGWAPVGLAFPYLAGSLGLAGALRICTRSWGEERAQAALLLSGHTLLMAALFLLSTPSIHIGLILASVISPLLGTVMLTSVLFAVYAAVDRLVEPELPSSLLRERARQRVRDQVRNKSSKDSGQG